jgi:glycosyltransferase involved in cell wall biosynthesis
MHILYMVTRGDVIGGASMHVIELAEEMQRLGHQVTLLIGRGEVVATLAQNRGLPVVVEDLLVRNIAPLTDLRCLLRLRKLIRQLQPDLIHLHSAKAGLLGRLAAKSVAMPVVYSVHGWAFNMYSGLLARIYRQLENWLLPLTDALVLVCQRDLVIAEKMKGTRAIPLAMVHNGIADNTLQARFTDRIPVRLICVARFEAPKDQATLLQALALLPAQCWQLTLVGDGPTQMQCRRLVEELALGQVIFAGERSDVPSLLQQADVFVLTSLSESLPLSVLEAMRAGLPVIASDVGGMAELVEHGKTGFLVPSAQPQMLADILKLLLADPSLRSKMGEAARQRFFDHFTLAEQGRRFAALYTQIVGVA